MCCVVMEMIVKSIEDCYERSRSQFTSPLGGFNDINDQNYKAKVLSHL